MLNAFDFALIPPIVCGRIQMQGIVHVLVLSIRRYLRFILSQNRLTTGSVVVMVRRLAQTRSVPTYGVDVLANVNKRTRPV